MMYLTFWSCGGIVGQATLLRPELLSDQPVWMPKIREIAIFSGQGRFLPYLLLVGDEEPGGMMSLDSSC